MPSRSSVMLWVHLIGLSLGCGSGAANAARSSDVAAAGAADTGRATSASTVAAGSAGTSGTPAATAGLGGSAAPTAGMAAIGGHLSAPSSSSMNTAAGSRASESLPAGAGSVSTAPRAGTGGMIAAESGGAGSGAGAPAAGAPQTTLGCADTPALKPGDVTYMVESNDRMRSYLLHVPARYDMRSPVPLVFDFHGYASNPQQQMDWSGFRELADQEGFVVVYPEGVGASWHVNGCCGDAAELKLDEIAFVRKVLEDVGRKACIDLARVYASGLSQGGGMAHHVACLAADVFAGVAPVSSDLRTDPCQPARPVTEISFRGLADTLDAYEGGHVGPLGMEGYTAIGARATLEKWKTLDACSGVAEKMDEFCETYSTCAQGSAVSLCSAPDTDHIFYWNPPGLNVAQIAWRLFKNHPRKP